MSRMFSISSDVSESVPRLRSGVASDASRGVSSSGFTNDFGVYIGMGIDGGRLRFTEVEDVGVVPMSVSGDTGDARSSTARV